MVYIFSYNSHPSSFSQVNAHWYYLVRRVISSIFEIFREYESAMTSGCVGINSKKIKSRRNAKQYPSSTPQKRTQLWLVDNYHRTFPKELHRKVPWRRSVSHGSLTIIDLYILQNRKFTQRKRHLCTITLMWSGSNTKWVQSKANVPFFE